jgi:uncharacterized protein
MQITNCHVHTFTHAHVPNRFVPPPFGFLLRRRAIRLPVLAIVNFLDRPRGRFARYAQVVERSYKSSQADVFDLVRSFYPRDTRFVVLPMDMAEMGAGAVERSIEEQHGELGELAARSDGLVIPFAAVDPRRDDVVEATRRLLGRGFRGIKLYPPLGYHPNDPALAELYALAAREEIPVMSHCSRPAGVRYRGPVTERMRTDPVTGERLGLSRDDLLTRFTDPDAYIPILEAYPDLRLCLAHFGGAADWRSYLEDPWGAGAASASQKSWLAKIVDLLKSERYENLYTDISYTVFADEEYVHLLKVLMSDERVARHVLFGSDFYVVEDAKLEERRIALRVRSLLGEDLFRLIAEENPRRYLGEAGERRAVPMAATSASRPQ